MCCQKYQWGLLFGFALYLIHFYTCCLLFVFPCLNLFPAQKIRKKTVEVPFEILGASTEQKSDLGVKQIIKSEIDFLL